MSGLTADRLTVAALPAPGPVKDATLRLYTGAPHGLASTTAYKDTFNADLLAFIID